MHLQAVVLSNTKAHKNWALSRFYGYSFVVLVSDKTYEI